jgi:hypothetical protein
VCRLEHLDVADDAAHRGLKLFERELAAFFSKDLLGRGYRSATESGGFTTAAW